MKKILLYTSAFLFVTVIVGTIYFAWERETMLHNQSTYNFQQVARYANKPSPSLSANQVVEIQLKALRHNDIFNTGIKRAFYFTTSYNNEGKKSYLDFQDMILSQKYASILNHRHVYRSPIEYYRQQAFQVVTVRDRQSRKIEFLFELELQKESPSKGCWLTKSVRIIREESPFSVI